MDSKPHLSRFGDPGFMTWISVSAFGALVLAFAMMLATGIELRGIGHLKAGLISGGFFFFSFGWFWWAHRTKNS